MGLEVKRWHAWLSGLCRGDVGGLFVEVIFHPCLVELASIGALRCASLWPRAPAHLLLALRQGGMHTKPLSKKKWCEGGLLTQLGDAGVAAVSGGVERINRSSRELQHFSLSPLSARSRQRSPAGAFTGTQWHPSFYHGWRTLATPSGV